MTAILEKIEALFKERGDDAYHGEAVTQTEHALQAAWAAEKSGADTALITAALLHDIGHMLHGHGEDCAEQGIDDQHEALGARFLARHFGPAVVEPVRLHVAAKRYLSAREPAYLARLSPASVLSLTLQGGPMSAVELADFDANPHCRAAVALRRWDEEAKVVNLQTPELRHFLPFVEQVAIAGGDLGVSACEFAARVQPLPARRELASEIQGLRMTSAPRAMIFDGPGQLLRLERPGRPTLQPGETLVRIRACTLCGSDLHTYSGRRSGRTPTILGHEIVGTIEALAETNPPCDAASGQPMQLGQRVTWSSSVGCGACFFCTHYLPQKCVRLIKYGHEKLAPEHQLSGGLATHIHLLSGTAIFALPDALPDSVACPANCATATVAAVARHAGDLRDAVTLIHGAGMLGLTAAALASANKARAVIVVDRDGERLRRASRFGATHVFQVPEQNEELRGTIGSLTDGRGVDVVLELSGAADAMVLGLDVVRIGGRCVWAGAVFPVPAISILPEIVVRKHLTICGVHNYAPRDLGAALKFLSQHHTAFPFTELVERVFPLGAADAAFDFAATQRPIRVALIPEEVS